MQRLSAAICHLDLILDSTALLPIPKQVVRIYDQIGQRFFGFGLAVEIVFDFGIVVDVVQSRFVSFDIWYPIPSHFETHWISAMVF
jgi:hypothetical protein